MRISIPLISILSLFFGLACPFGRPFLQVGRLPQLERVILGVFTAHGRLSGIQDPRFDNLHYITFASFPQPTIETGTRKHPDLDIPLPLPFPFPSLDFLASLACIRCIVCMYGLFGTWRAARKIDSRNSHALKDLRHRFGRSYEVRLVDSILKSTMKHRMHLQVWTSSLRASSSPLVLLSTWCSVGCERPSYATGHTRSSYSLSYTSLSDAHSKCRPSFASAELTWFVQRLVTGDREYIANVRIAGTSFGGSSCRWKPSW